MAALLTRFTFTLPEFGPPMPPQALPGRWSHMLSATEATSARWKQMERKTNRARRGSFEL